MLIYLNAQMQWFNHSINRKTQTSSIYWLNKIITKLIYRVHPFYSPSKMLSKYLNTIVFKYCITEFVYVYQVNASLKSGISFQNKLYIFKLLIKWLLVYFDMKHWKCNNICYTWKIKKSSKSQCGLFSYINVILFTFFIFP